MSEPGTAPANLAVKTVQGTFWTYASVYSAKAINFLTTIILARLLSKDDFGVVGYALVTISFLEVLKDLGVGPALIYHKEDEDAPHTAFWLSLLVGFGLGAASLLVAPLAALYFQDDRAIGVIQVLALSFPLGAIGNVHDTLLSKQLRFKRQFSPSLVRVAGKGIASIGLALAGYGVWSLIIGQLVGVALTTVTFWVVQPWRPEWRFSMPLARSLLTYGFNIVALNTLAILLLNLDYLFVGRWLGATALGVYTLAFRIPDMLITQFGQVVSKVIFPIYVRMRDAGESLQQGFLTTLRYVSLVTVPIGVGVALVAEPFVITFLTDKWAEAIPVLQAIAIYAMLFSLSYNAGSLYKAQGRPEILTRLALVRLALLAPALYWATTQIGTLAAIGWTHAAVALVAGTLNLYVATRSAGVRFSKVLLTILPSVVASAVMAGAVWGVLWLVGGVAAWLQLAAGVTVGVVVYGGMLLLVEPGAIQESQQVMLAAVRRR